MFFFYLSLPTTPNATIVSNIDITIDLNGKHLNLQGKYLNPQGGKLTITDTSSEKAGSVTSTAYAVSVKAGSTFELQNGSVSSTGEYAIFNKGTLILQGGTGTITGSKYGIVNNDANAKVTVSGGTIEGTNEYGIHNNAGEVTVNGTVAVLELVFIND